METLSSSGSVKSKKGKCIQCISKSVITYTVLRKSTPTPLAILLLRGFDRGPLKLDKQIIPHFLALDVGFEISLAQLCSSIRGCHATIFTI